MRVPSSVGCADGVLGGGGLDQRQRLVVLRGRHEHPRPGGAGLAAVDEAVGQADLDGLAEVGVVEHDERALAAQLERHLLDGVGGDRHDALARGGRAGERDHVDVGVRGDRLADDRAEAGDEVEDAGGQADLLEDLGQRVRRQRRDLGRLQHDGAAGGQRRGDLGDHLVQRVVPRRDGADDADRLLDDERVGDLLLELVGLQDRGVRPQHPHRVADLDGLAEGQRRAHLGADEQRDLVGARLERVGRGGQQRGALGGRARGPRLEGAAGGGDGGVDVLGGTGRDRGDLLLGGGVDDGDGLAAGGRHPRAVDEEGVLDLHVSSSGSVPRA